MNVSNMRRIVLLGRTGSGKSSLANTILGEPLYKTSHTLNSETKECQAETRSVNGRRITLIDTPCVFGGETSEEELNHEIVRCITLCAPGLHAFLMVLKVEKFTEHEQAVIQNMQQLFSEEALKHTAVVFTHGDQLPEGQTIEDFVRQDQPLRELVEKCGGRCHVIDNKYWKNNQQDEYRSNKFQVEELLKTIDKMTEENGNSCYTNDMLQAVEEKIQQKEEHIRQSSENVSEEKIREQATVSTFQGLLSQLADTPIAALLGAFLGYKKAEENKRDTATVTGALGAAFGTITGVFCAAGVMIGGIAGYCTAKRVATGMRAGGGKSHGANPNSRKRQRIYENLPESCH